jgi:hypothetical protein
MKQSECAMAVVLSSTAVHLDKALQGSDAGATADGLTAGFTIAFAYC